MPVTPTWPSHPDPHLSLETETPATLAWVEQQNRRSHARWRNTPVVEQLRARLEQAYLPDDLPVLPSRVQDFVYHVLVDADHPRGLWRRMAWSDWRAGANQWETLLDIDALGEKEELEWQLATYHMLHPDGDRALILLSPGGSDAVVVREFDITTRTFVDQGFSIPQAGHHSVSWIDRDTLYVLWDAGDEQASPLTHGGFPYQARRWSRGTALQNAPVVFTGEASDVAVQVWFDPFSQRHEAVRNLDFFDWYLYYMDQQGVWHNYALPAWVHCAYWKEWIILSLRKEWQCGDTVYPGGTLLAIREQDLLANEWSSLAVLFAPTQDLSTARWYSTKNHLLVTYLNDLRSTTIALTPSRHARGIWEWAACDLAFPDLAHTTTWPVAPTLNDDIYVSMTGYLTPAQLWLADLSEPAGWEQLAGRFLIGNQPAAFDATPFDIRRGDARSADGTRVPYVVIGARERLTAGNLTPSPCLLTGYGGFGVTIEPHYVTGTAIGWLEAGGIFVRAHIRGGGEFGEQWHQAAQRELRQRCFDDFIAVAEALISSGLTTPAQLGIQGASNGGLLVAACAVQRPDLFGAVVCEGALLDMERYPHLHMGAIWIDEYGDPAEENAAAALMAYSPFHCVRADVVYPPILFTTSTNDDRVHPAHARKMVAVMQDQGHNRVWYLEKQDGGHSMLDALQAAEYDALVFGFLQALLIGKT